MVANLLKDMASFMLFAKRIQNTNKDKDKQKFSIYNLQFSINDSMKHWNIQ